MAGMEEFEEKFREWCEELGGSINSKEFAGAKTLWCSLPKIQEVTIKIDQMTGRNCVGMSALLNEEMIYAGAVEMEACIPANVELQGKGELISEISLSGRSSFAGVPVKIVGRSMLQLSGDARVIEARIHGDTVSIKTYL